MPKLASSRKDNGPTPKTRRPLPQIKREELFGWYILILGAPILFIVTAHLAVAAHDEFIPEAIATIWRETIWFAKQVFRSPTIILAFALVAAFIWCFPWESLLSDKPAYEPMQGFRRGRRMSMPNRASGRLYDRRARRNQSDTRRRRRDR